MRFSDITHDTQAHYTLTEAGEYMFFMKNRSGSILFDMLCPAIRLNIVGIYEGNNSDELYINLRQRHVAEDCHSHTLIACVLRDNSQFIFNGTIAVKSGASQAVGSLTNRNLLMDKSSRAQSKPQLEIHNNDVRCRHASTTSSPPSEQMAYARSRGMTLPQAKEFLARAFLEEAYSTVRPYFSHEKNTAR